MKILAKPYWVVIMFLFVSFANAQEDTSKSTFTVDIEFRPRTELRNGFRYLREDTTSAAFFTSQRSRINLSYSTNKFLFYTSIQDVRVWGDHDPKDISGTFSLFESYVEISFNSHFSTKIGRQKIMYDNQRLFAQNDWRQNAGAHDALLFKYASKKIKSELALAFNQQAENYFGTEYTSSGISYYKALAVHYFNVKINEVLTLTTINTADGFESTTNTAVLKFRYTHGGRIELTKGKNNFTLAAYYQHGATTGSQKINAWYVQPEYQVKDLGPLSIRLGAEVFSGNDALDTINTEYNSFVPLYGVNHRFNGTMEYFTNKPKDLGYAGLINPYLFFTINISKKASIKSDQHLFFSQTNYVKNSAVINKYLGFENDIIFSYKPNSFTTLDWGVSWMIATESLEIIKGSGNRLHLPYWSYIQLTLKPQLFKSIF